MNSIRPILLALICLLFLIAGFFTISDISAIDIAGFLLFGFGTIYFTYRIFYPINDNLPESKWFVSFDEFKITSVDFQKNESIIKFSEIKEVTIFTNDSGPVGIDIWWRISDGKEKLLFVPGGATGEQQMVERLQKLKDFDNTKLIEAMGSTDNAEFLLWNKN